MLQQDENKYTKILFGWDENKYTKILFGYYLTDVANSWIARQAKLPAGYKFLHSVFILYMHFVCNFS